MKKIELQEQAIMEFLQVTKKASVADIIHLLQVSESTVRRLFNRLESKGCVLRCYGGIQLLSGGDSDYLYEQVETRNIEKKMEIANSAISEIEGGDIVYLDSGTTLAHFSMALSRKLERKELQNITIFTNSLINLHILQDQITINLIGGEYRKHRKDFCGYIAEETVKTLHFTKCFLGADGYNVQNGFTATDFHTARLAEIALNSSEQHYILMDSSKFSTPAFVSYSQKCHIDVVYTDALPESTVLSQMERDGIRVKVVPLISKSRVPKTLNNLPAEQ